MAITILEWISLVRHIYDGSNSAILQAFLEFSSKVPSTQEKNDGWPCRGPNKSSRGDLV